MYKCCYFMENEDNTARAYVFRNDVEMQEHIRLTNNEPSEMVHFDKGKTLAGITNFMIDSLSYYDMLTYVMRIKGKLFVATI